MDVVTARRIDDAKTVHDLLDKIEVEIECFTRGRGLRQVGRLRSSCPETYEVVVPPSKTAMESGTETPMGRVRNATIALARGVGQRHMEEGDMVQ